MEGIVVGGSGQNDRWVESEVEGGWGVGQRMGEGVLVYGQMQDDRWMQDDGNGMVDVCRSVRQVWMDWSQVDGEWGSM